MNLEVLRGLDAEIRLVGLPGLPAIRWGRIDLLDLEFLRGRGAGVRLYGFPGPRGLRGRRRLGRRDEWPMLLVLSETLGRDSSEEHDQDGGNTGSRAIWDDVTHDTNLLRWPEKPISSMFCESKPVDMPPRIARKWKAIAL